MNNVAMTILKPISNSYYIKVFTFHRCNQKFVYDRNVDIVVDIFFKNLKNWW